MKLYKAGACSVIFRSHLRTVHYLKLEDYRSAYLTSSGRSAIVRRSLIAASTATAARKKKLRQGRPGRRRPASALSSRDRGRRTANHAPRKKVSAKDGDSSTLGKIVESLKEVPVDPTSTGMPLCKVETNRTGEEAPGQIENRLPDPGPPPPLPLPPPSVLLPQRPPSPPARPKVFVNNFEESCLSLCRLCGLVYPVDSIRNHLKIAHLINIKQYREQYGHLEYVRETYLRSEAFKLLFLLALIFSFEIF